MQASGGCQFLPLLLQRLHRRQRQVLHALQPYEGHQASLWLRLRQHLHRHLQLMHLLPVAQGLLRWLLKRRCLHTLQKKGNTRARPPSAGRACVARQ